MIVNIKGSAKGKSEVKGVCDAGKSVGGCNSKRIGCGSSKGAARGPSIREGRKWRFYFSPRNGMVFECCGIRI